MIDVVAIIKIYGVFLLEFSVVKRSGNLFMFKDGEVTCLHFFDSTLGHTAVGPV